MADRRELYEAALRETTALRAQVAELTHTLEATRGEVDAWRSLAQQIIDEAGSQGLWPRWLIKVHDLLIREVWVDD